MRLLARHIVLYRPTFLTGIAKCQSGYEPCYGVGDLRARLFGVRVPVLWALGKLIAGGVL